MNKTQKVILSILIFIIVAITVILINVYVAGTYVYLPTKSTSETLTIVSRCNFFVRRIIYSQYIDEQPICDYILDIPVSHDQSKQKYKLPKLTEGYIKITVELEGYCEEPVKDIIITYDNAEELYHSGLLIYTDAKFIYGEDYVLANRYTHFISKKDRRCYELAASATDWALSNNQPELICIEKQKIGYQIGYEDDWYIDNKWILVPANDKGY